MTTGVQNWLDKLGYSAEPAVLHVRGTPVSETHPYALEIKALLRPDGAIRAQAVFEVEGVPTVVFVGDDDNPLTSAALDDARKRIWNQNLATIVIEFKGDQALALPARKLKQAGERLRLEEARPDGPFSALDVATANLSRRLPKWFDVKARVDRKLLANLSTTVSKLSDDGYPKVASGKERRRLAELLMGQVLFVSYLEHREIVGTTYRQRREVAELHGLVTQHHRDGIRTLIDWLRSDFNGDFLGGDRHDPWTALSDAGFDLLNQFLRRTDMRTGQGDFWNYDFSYIPVELLSGLYEKFLTPEQQAKEGAYYTPRNLAMLAVDQAFMASPDPIAETIFDGACGSGILLTTAYRRLIALSEAKQGRQLGFAERARLLERSIFGGDINFMACRVTAFSLYLSLLEGLDPADILAAQERDGTKLPSLNGKNLIHGNDEADFFRKTHTFHGRRFSLIISNPPWAEPEGEDHTSTDDWADAAGVPFARRQIAGAYALRAREFLSEGGRVCLILPIGQFLGASSAAFVSHVLSTYRPTRLINFGDLQGLLFPTAENTCHVFLGEARSDESAIHIPFDETFEYLVPKADLSLALGRLTMQSADRHALQTRSVAEDPQLLVTMMWGDASDLAIWTRLALRGTFADFWQGPREFRRWVNRKGIHLNDKSRDAVDVGELRDKPHVPIAALSAGSPVLHPILLTKWPATQDTVVGLNDAVRAVFDGPRVLFPDGFSKGEQNIRAVYYDGPASFTHSIGVIAGKQEDAALLQFSAIYLRSTLARYFLMMRGWKMLCERNGVHLADVEAFPFFAPEDAPDVVAASSALATVQAQMTALTALPELDQGRRYADLRSEFDDAVFSYFGLTAEEQILVRETVEVLMPSIRPRSFKSLDTPAQHRADADDLKIYARALAEALTTWRTKTHGSGRFHVNVMASDPSRSGPSGIVRVAYSNQSTGQPQVSTEVSDELVLETLTQLRKAGLRVIASGDFLALVPDVHLWFDGALYLVRPLTQRSWTVRQALRDAEHIVRSVQSRQSGQKAAVSA
ncbi:MULTISPECIES: N-6 DNA methylase [unclassified Devosia]|uniref:N-6 DNA methylase n=1 Tax=unclassified Devosia TaxID=196773 RepID=UPI00086A71DB|nr:MULTISPECIES: N-6 DNA methylase [unclassified Devosia]ODS88398.1 MAG: DNA methylase [Devosia sp. SCN 66-27]OJX24015.1 MAG: DNA methylase [Devosia sp. 66-14]